MTSIHSIDSCRGQICIKFQNEIGSEELLDIITQLRENPGFNTTFGILLDLRESTLSLSYNDLIGLLKSVEDGKAKLGRLAIIPGKPVNLGISRMYGQIAEFHHEAIDYFDTEESARAWLSDASQPD